MDEVSWHVRLDLPTTTGKGTRIIAVRLVPFMLLPRLVPGSSGTLCRQPRRHWLLIATAPVMTEDLTAWQSSTDAND